MISVTLKGGPLDGRVIEIDPPPPGMPFDSIKISYSQDGEHKTAVYSYILRAPLDSPRVAVAVFDDDPVIAPREQLNFDELADLIEESGQALTRLTEKLGVKLND